MMPTRHGADLADRTQPVPASTPECRVVDSLIHCDEVVPGDLMLFRGDLTLVEAVESDASQPAYICITLSHASLGEQPRATWWQRHLYAAVRRYTEE